MREEIINLPSKAKVVMRQLLFKEENILAKAAKTRRSEMNNILISILKNCTVRIEDPGPYDFLKGTQIMDWDKVISGDRVGAMIGLRKISYKEGNKVLISDVRCQSCRNDFSWEVNLDEDLKYQELPEDSFKRLEAGKPFTVKIDGHEIKFILPTGETEAKYQKLRKQNKGRDMASGLRSRIIGVTKPDGEEIHPRDIIDWLDGEGKGKYPGLTSDDAEDIRDKMDLVDGGIDLEVTADCDDCGSMVRFDLPFDSIFLPGRGIQERKMKRRGVESSEH